MLNPQERVWGPSPSSAAPQPPTRGAEEPRLAARIPVCPCGCGHGSIQDWITPTSAGPPSPKTPGTPPLLLPAGPSCRDWGVWEVPRPLGVGWAAEGPPIQVVPDPVDTSRSSNHHSLLRVGSPLCPPIPVPGGAGTGTGLWGRAGDTPGWLWGHSEGLWVIALGTGRHQDRGDMQGVPRDVHWGCGDGHTLVPTGAPLPWQRPTQRDQRPGLKEKVENPRSSIPSAVRERRGGRRASIAPRGPSHRPPPPPWTIPPGSAPRHCIYVLRMLFYQTLDSIPN